MKKSAFCGHKENYSLQKGEKIPAEDFPRVEKRNFMDSRFDSFLHVAFSFGYQRMDGESRLGELVSVEAIAADEQIGRAHV